MKPTDMTSHRPKKIPNGLPGPSLLPTDIAQPVRAINAHTASMSLLWIFASGAIVSGRKTAMVALNISTFFARLEQNEYPGARMRTFL
jgi:hypothetical protein